MTNLLKGRLWRAARWSGGLAETIEGSSQAIQSTFEDEEPAKFIGERLQRR